MGNLNKYAQPFLRLGLALVFFYFGFQQIYSPSDWAGFIPRVLIGTALTANNWVVMNGIMELTLGTFLLIGLYTRISALILGLHLVGIAALIGLSPIGVRDFGLAVATLTLVLLDNDRWSIDSWSEIRRNKILEEQRVQ